MAEPAAFAILAVCAAKVLNLPTLPTPRFINKGFFNANHTLARADFPRADF